MWTHHRVFSSSVVRASVLDHRGWWVQIPAGARNFLSCHFMMHNDLSITCISHIPRLRSDLFRFFNSASSSFFIACIYMQFMHQSIETPTPRVWGRVGGFDIDSGQKASILPPGAEIVIKCPYPWGKVFLSFMIEKKMSKCSSTVCSEFCILGLLCIVQNYANLALTLLFNQPIINPKSSCVRQSKIVSLACLGVRGLKGKLCTHISLLPMTISIQHCPQHSK